VLAYFRPVSNRDSKNKKNTKKNKLLFSFRMYDLDGDGEISVVSRDWKVRPVCPRMSCSRSSQ
jgi:hypothetical protein